MQKIEPRYSKTGTDTQGVYILIHKMTRKKYIGSSVQVERRLGWHITILATGKHHCYHMQRVWNKYGSEEFDTYLLEPVADEKRLVVREQWHMDRTNPALLMNVCPVAGSALGRKMSEECKVRMSEHAIRIAACPEERKRRSERCKKQHAEGRIGYRPRKTEQLRLCRECGEQFSAPRLPSVSPKKVGPFSNTKWCNKCRKPHHGGYYKRAKPLPAGDQT
jgi:group I intron endonuclease